MELPKEAGIAALSPRTAWLIAILVAALQAAMAVTAVNTKSPTFDEPQHLTAGYSYFVTNDFRLDPENGNLPAIWAALGAISACDTFETIGSYGTIQGPKIATSIRRKTPVAATPVRGLPRRIQPI